MTRAGFGPRAAAYLLDRAIVLAGLCLVRLPFGVAALFGAGGPTAKDFLFDHSFLDVLCWALGAAYFVLLTVFCGGATLGKRVMRLRLVRADGEPLRFLDVLYRETVGRFLSGILCLGYLMALADREHRAFHDWLCGTAVVYDGVTLPERRRPDPAEHAWTPTEPALPAAEPDTLASGPALPETPFNPFAGYSIPGEPAEKEDGDAPKT